MIIVPSEKGEPMIAIPNIKKPKNCYQCSFNDGIYCALIDNDTDAFIKDNPTEVATKVLPTCPLIEIPSGTCRLVEEFYPGELKAKQPVGSFIMYRSADEDDGRFILKVED